MIKLNHSVVISLKNGALLFLITMVYSCKPKEKDTTMHPFCASEYCSEKGKEELKLVYKQNKTTSDTIFINIGVVIATNKPQEDFNIAAKIKEINAIYASALIQFKLLPKIHYRIQNYTIDEIQDNSEIRNKVTQGLEKENSINLFIVPKGNYLNGFTFVVPDDFINYFNLKCNTIFINDKAWFNQSTLAHELGHFFGLQHTFGKSPEENSTPEKADGSNCTEEGDFICDTPADPNGLINKKCEYIGLSDKKKHGYKPFVNNYMSYYRNTCKNEFTTEQYKAMNAFANKFRTYLFIKKH